MKKYALIVLALVLAGCNGAGLTGSTSAVVGEKLVSIGKTLVAIECSPALPVAGQVVTNALRIVAPTTQAADTVSAILAVNSALTAQLCPLATTIVADVGQLPAGKASLTVSATEGMKTGSAQGVSAKIPVIKNY